MEDDLIYLNKKTSSLYSTYFSFGCLRTLTILYPLIKCNQCIMFVFSRFDGTLRLIFFLSRSKKTRQSPVTPLYHFVKYFRTVLIYFFCSYGPWCSICQLHLFVTLFQIVLNFQPIECKVLLAVVHSSCSGGAV